MKNKILQKRSPDLINGKPKFFNSLKIIFMEKIKMIHSQFVEFVRNLKSCQFVNIFKSKKYIDTINSKKQDVIEDLDNIRNNANLGATALQTIPDEYLTENEMKDFIINGGEY